MPYAKKSDLFLLAMNQFIWGTGWSAIKYPQDQMGPVALNIWTLGISVVVLLPFAWPELVNKSLNHWGNARKLTSGDYCDYFILGFIGLGGMTLLYNWGAGRSLAANGALIAMSVPILTAIIAVFILSEKITPGRVISLVIALVGVIIISDIRWGQLDFFGNYLFGSILFLLGAVCNAVYVVFSKRLLAISSPVVLLFWAQLLGFLISLPFIAFEGFHFQAVLSYRWQTWVALWFLGAIYFAFTMILFNRILVRLDAGQIMVSNYLQPFFGVFMAAMLLHERITLPMIVGGILVVGGTVVATFEDSWHRLGGILRRSRESL
jgi:drug/metabolite transporter (DMT)-like permease